MTKLEEMLKLRKELKALMWEAIKKSTETRDVEAKRKYLLIALEIFRWWEWIDEKIKREGKRN